VGVDRGHGLRVAGVHDAVDANLARAYDIFFDVIEEDHLVWPAAEPLARQLEDAPVGLGDASAPRLRACCR